jgi:hypothetical protein
VAGKSHHHRRLVIAFWTYRFWAGTNPHEVTIHSGGQAGKRKDGAVQTEGLVVPFWNRDFAHPEICSGTNAGTDGRPILIHRFGYSKS